MTNAEKKQLAELVLELENILTVLNPDVRFDALSVQSVDQLDLTGLDIKSVHDLAKAVRMNARYNRFDLEACRRELAGLLQIIDESEINGK